MNYVKHEVITCDRCGAYMECRANTYNRCSCSTVQLTINETQYISEQYDNCLCCACLEELKEEYKLS